MAKRERIMSSKVLSAKGGCERCTARWDSKNALGLAAQHHDSTGHPTWVEQTQRTVYGGGPARATQASMF